MGRFGNLAGVRTNGSGIYFEQGDYDVRIDKIKFNDDTRTGEDAFIIETTVVRSDNPTRAPGCKPSQVITLKKQYLETCLGDVKQFVGAMLEIEDPDSYNEPIDVVDQITAQQMGCDLQTAANNRFWEQAIDMLCSEENPGRGTLIHVNCTIRPGKKDPTKSFTKHVWGPVLQTASDDTVAF